MYELVSLNTLMYTHAGPGRDRQTLYPIYLCRSLNSLPSATVYVVDWMNAKVKKKNCNIMVYGAGEWWRRSRQTEPSQLASLPSQWCFPHFFFRLCAWFWTQHKSIKYRIHLATFPLSLTHTRPLPQELHIHKYTQKANPFRRYTIVVTLWDVTRWPTWIVKSGGSFSLGPVWILNYCCYCCLSARRQWLRQRRRRATSPLCTTQKYTPTSHIPQQQQMDRSHGTKFSDRNHDKVSSATKPFLFHSAGKWY